MTLCAILSLLSGSGAAGQSDKYRMRVNQKGMVFAFSFDSVEDITTFNLWLDEAGHPQSKVPIPTSRQQRRVATKSPAMFRALDQDAVRAIRARWID